MARANDLFSPGHALVEHTALDLFALHIAPGFDKRALRLAVIWRDDVEAAHRLLGRIDLRVLEHFLLDVLLGTPGCRSDSR